MANTVLIFIASITGIMAYFTTLQDEAFVFGTVAVLVAGAATIAAREMVLTNPVLATRLFIAWRVFPLAAIFLGGYLSAWMALNILDYLPFEFTSDLDGTAKEIEAAIAAQKSTASSLIIAAINTLLGALVLEAAKDPSSRFWPSEIQKKALKKKLDDHPAFQTKNPGDEVRHALEDLRYAYGEDSTNDNSAQGWSYKARMQRAKIIEASKKTLTENGIQI